MTGPSDPDRRQFFRRFAGEVVRSAVSVVGAVEELRERSAAEAASLLRPDPEPDPAAVAVLDAPAPDQAAAAAATAAAATASPAGPWVGSDGHVIPDPVPGEARGFRTPFRFAPGDDATLLVIDQRRLPDQLIELPVRSAREAAAGLVRRAWGR